MGLRCSLKKVWLLTALLVACGDDGSFDDEQPRDDGLTIDEPAPSTAAPTRDASGPTSRADASSAADASTTRDDDAGQDNDDLLDAGASEPLPEPEPDASTLDAGPARDASVTRRDAAVVLPDASAPVDAGSTNPADYSCEQLSYESFGRAFMKRYCNNCHSAQKPTLLTLETVALNKAVVMQTTVTTTRMPLKSGNVPSTAERVQLGVWLNCGPY